MKPDITPTDWDGYYAKRLATSTLTRKISERLIVGLIKRHVPHDPVASVLELGGGDSCFYEAFRALFPSCRYTVIDKSREGVAKFLAKHGRDNVAAIQEDILRADFDHVRPGGLVLITFPTNRFLYGVIRWFAEKLNLWAFPDERPLDYGEVASIIGEFGQVLERKTNWYIGLTQEIVVARKTR